MPKSLTLFSSDDEDEEGLHQEIKVLRKFQSMLQGVPPPSSVTMSKLSVSDMLSKYRENENSFGVTPINNIQKFNSKNNSTPLVYYLNSSHTSEEIANLSQRVQSRYIYSETLSSCNIWFESSIKTNSAKKQSGHRNGFGPSPGSRLSHLARRRQVFSCENLQQLANSDKRHHIKIRKFDALKNKTLLQNETVEFKKLNLSKRALFQSPDEGRKEAISVSCNSVRRNLFASSDQVLAENSKMLGQQNYVEGFSKKRKRQDLRDGVLPKRALSFSEGEEEENSKKSQETKNSKVISELQLSLHHKSKLLWAVSVTLKEKNMSSKDPQFKTCASALFMICRENLGKILNLEVEGGTSEKMLHFAKGQIDDIFKKLGICRDGDPKDTRLDSLDVRNEANVSNCLEHVKDN